MTDADQRNAQRLRALKTARVQFEDNKPPADCLVRSLSPEGARIDIDRQLTVGGRVGLYFVTENTTVMARVVWQEGKSAGLEFDHTPHGLETIGAN